MALYLLIFVLLLINYDMTKKKNTHLKDGAVMSHKNYSEMPHLGLD